MTKAHSQSPGAFIDIAHLVELVEAARAQMADGLAVARQLGAAIVDDAQGCAETGAARHLATVELFLVAEMFRAGP